MRIAIIGGGAAGFFAAIRAAENPNNKVEIFEKSSKLLAKVRISGGGRCNVTHHCDYASKLINFYPRGGKSLRKGFEKFGTKDTVNWFESRGVPLKIEEDGRMFPVSEDSESIINCLLNEAKKNRVEIRLKTNILKLNRKGEKFVLDTGKEPLLFDKVIVASGGHPKIESYKWLSNLGIKIVEPIPSLFTFNCPKYGMKDLKGLSVPNAIVQLPGTKWKQNGPLLITHWGFSGPVIIKLSAWAAIDLFHKNYQFPILINWLGIGEENARDQFINYKELHPKKKVVGNSFFGLPSRLWSHIVEKSDINDSLRFVDLNKKQINKLLENLIRDNFQVNGKTTFKEEFVTSGGVDLHEVDLSKFELKAIPGLYFVGEILNVDGVTGGFNFQHAWTSGFIAGKNAGVN